MAEAIDIQTQLDQRWLVFLWALPLSLVILGFAWARGFFKPFKSTYLPTINGEDVLRGFIAFIFVEVLLIPYAVYLLVPGIQTNEAAKGWVNLMLVLGAFTAAVFVYFLLTPTQKKEFWDQSSDNWWTNVLIGFAGWAISFPLVLAITQIISIGIWHLFHRPFIEQSVVESLRLAKENPPLFAATAFGIVVLVPFTEEFLFRGLLQNWLKQKLGLPWLSVFITSLIFASFHFTFEQGISNIELLFSLVILSCFLGYVYERQRSLWAPIGLHGLFNFVSLLLIFGE